MRMVTAAHHLSLLLLLLPYVEGFSMTPSFSHRVPKFTVWSMSGKGGGGASGESLFKGDDKRSVILFDGVCNLCNGGVNFVLDVEEKLGSKSSSDFRFAALQSSSGKSLLKRGGRDEYDISSIVFSTPEGTYTKSEAVLRIGADMFDKTPLFPLAIGAKAAIALVPSVVRDAVYDTIANNRYSLLGKRDESECRFDADRGEKFKDSFLVDP